MIILGLNAYHPDSSAAIILDGNLIAAVEEERFCRIKHWAGFPKQSIAYCLKEAGIDVQDLDYICLNRDPRAHFFKKIGFVLTHGVSASFVKDRLANILKISALKDTFMREFLPSGTLRAKIYTVEHHQAHLASAFYVSPFDTASVVSIDGFGDFSSCMVAKGEGSLLRSLGAVFYPHSLGIFYTAFTQYLGFKKFGDEYKVMGLAAYGKPKYIRQIEEILTLLPNGKFTLRLDYFSFYKKRSCMLWDNTEPFLDDVFSSKMAKKFGAPREYTDELTDYHCDLAASLQAVYEKAFFHILNHAYKLTGISKLCLAGGCALNSVANGKIFDQTPFTEVYIQPAASDAGGALGSCYYMYHQILKRERSFVMEHAYWGPEFSEEEITKDIKQRGAELEGCLIERIEKEDDLCRKTAELIAEGKIVGWFQGRMEWGPRALGNRSILVDPRREDMKDILNERIKRREWFRPFAPTILIEKVGDYFEKDYPDPFMLKVYPIKEDKRTVIPAVTHVDGTGRLQTVSKKENPRYWQLIKEFEKITGVPIVLNTSFNENEPIVLGPQDALDCFLRTKMDILVMGNVLIERG